MGITDLFAKSLRKSKKRRQPGAMPKSKLLDLHITKRINSFADPPPGSSFEMRPAQYHSHLFIAGHIHSRPANVANAPVGTA